MTARRQGKVATVIEAGLKCFYYLIIDLFVAGLLLGLGQELFGLTIERKQKYATALASIERAGGWQAIEAAGLVYFTNVAPGNYSDEHFFRRGGRTSTNSLPAILEALEPWRIEYKPDSNGVYFLQLRLFGIHRSGTYAEPYYGIWVNCTNASFDYIPAVVAWNGEGKRGLVERKGGRVFEVR